MITIKISHKIVNYYIKLIFKDLCGKNIAELFKK